MFRLLVDKSTEKGMIRPGATAAEPLRPCFPTFQNEERRS
jgi:hypothetical protein